ncbi:unnamed protein product, partial [Amoebophrya sp. A120]
DSYDFYHDLVETRIRNSHRNKEHQRKPQRKNKRGFSKSSSTSRNGSSKRKKSGRNKRSKDEAASNNVEDLVVEEFVNCATQKDPKKAEFYSRGSRSGSV